MHDDRDVEFIMLKRAIDQYIEERYPKERGMTRNLGSTSCEQLAADLMIRFDLSRCVVFEDGENGGGVER